MSEALKRDFKICEEIGRGRFGTVFKCESNISGKSFAVKSIDKAVVSGDSIDSQCLSMEPKVLQHLSSHPHVMKLHGTYEDDDFLHMVIDLCTDNDLHTLIVNNNGGLTETVSRVIFKQLMEAICHCHKYGVIHRDIKPENLLFDGDTLKLADFGSAALVVAEKVSGVVGTPYYVAPEVLEGNEYGVKVDVWSAGVVLYVMLAGFPPWSGETVVEIFEAVARANLRFPMRVFDGVSPAVKDLLRRMLCKDVSRRFTAEQVLRHPLVTSGG